MITPSPDEGLKIEALPAFSDNYLWLAHDGVDATVVDPGDAATISRALEARRLRLRSILITHHHPDHVGGVAALKAATGAVVYGPAAEASKIGTLDHQLKDGDVVTLTAPSLALQVLAVPGHTLGHIAYYAEMPAPGLLFCGDTLFSGGCGRLFEGTPEQMESSLQRLAALPASTLVFCAHEYTLANLLFAQTVEPENPAVEAAVREVSAWREAGRASVPSSIGRELRINPFLRIADPALRESVRQHAVAEDGGSDGIFAALRRWKDGYRPPFA